PGVSVAEVLEAAGWPGAEGSVVLVGHQPTFGRVAAFLLAGVEAEWDIAKGGLWWINRAAKRGAVEIAVRAVIVPDLL
ncbi:MAG: histidine phosphatase family protein, partial [Burkholderiales bacterium]